MKTTQNQNSNGSTCRISATFRRAFVPLAGVLVFTLQQSTALAQTRQVRAQPTRITVQSGVSGIATTTIYVITTNTDTPINLAVGPLPAGVDSATLDKNSFLNPGGSATLTVHYNGSVPQTGTNEIQINASGDYTYLLPVPIHSAVIWSGNTNSTAWANAGNWEGGVLPTTSDTVVFPSSGANDQGTNSFTNVVVTINREVAGLRFSHGDSTNDQTYGFQIQPGATLAVTGGGGFSLLQDTINLSGDMEVKFFGGGNLVVSNANANVAVLKEAGQRSILNMGGLNTFVADVNRLGFGDYTLYPYYTNNGYSVVGGSATNARPARFLPLITLAATNFIHATYVDPSNYNDAENRNYALTLSKDETQGLGSGSATQCGFLLGRSNVFFMDGIVFGGSVAKAT
ncbi:MAG TPA: hypothetical protein VFM25_07940, partial [Verrucomicrobiae bacterium]|nr:hypothetical protein [Verrucomicrobiae bacterium]